MNSVTMNGSWTWSDVNFGQLTFFFSELTTWNYVVFSCIILCGIVGNGLLLFAIYKDPLKCFRNSTTILISNLAVSDLLNNCISLFDMVLSLTNIGGVFGLSKLPSKILMPILNCLFSSTYPFVFSIAVERYVAISRPLWHKIHATRHFCSTCVIILWLICFAYTGICSALRNANLELTYYNAVQSCFLLLFFFGSVASYFLAFLSMRRQRQTLENVTSELTRQTAQVRLKNQSNFLKIIFIVNIFLIFGLLPTVCFFVLVSISVIIIFIVPLEILLDGNFFIAFLTYFSL